MSCGFDRELLSVYADGILEPERASQVEVHLSGCRECRRELEVLRGLGRALTSLPREQASSELLARILFQAEGRAHRTVLGVALRTAGAVWSVAMNKFNVEDEWAKSLRAELPEWVLRWVLYV